MPIDQINPTSTVNDVITSNAATLAVFNAFGVDTCCGGAASLEEAARDAGLSLDKLLDALEEAARTTAEGR